MFETETFRLHVVERPDPAEVLGWIGEGRVRLRIPLRKRALQLGPVSLRLDTSAVLELTVRGGEIDRGTARGHLDPPVRLPLGFEAERIRLSSQGDVILGLRGLPDVNLSALVPWLPRIPARLRDLGERLAQRAPHPKAPSSPDSVGVDAEAPSDGSAPTTPAGASPRSPGDPGTSAAEGLEVEARAVRPLPGVVIDLGLAGRLELDPRSRLDVTLTGKRLVCDGELVLADGELEGPAFRAEGIRSRGGLHWVRKEQLDLTDLVAHADHLAWSHGQAWRLTDVELSSARIAYARSADRSVSGTLRLTGEAALDPTAQPAEASASRAVTLRVELGERGIRDVREEPLD